MSQVTEQLVQLHHQLQNQLNKSNPMILELELAVALSCSPKQVVQLVDTLKNEFGAPIIAAEHPKQYGYRQDFELPLQVLTASDWQQIVTVLNLLEDLNGRHDSLGFKTVQQTLHNLLLEHQVDPLSVRRRVKVIGRQHRALVGHIVESVANAVFKRKRVLLKYANATRELSEREVSPQRLILYREQWYLDAWCHQRQGMRTFSVARINSALLQPSAAKEFSELELDQHTHRQYGLLSGAERHIAELQFYNRAATQVSQQQWHPDAVGRWSGACYQLTLPYVDDRELIGDLLSFAPDIEVLKPTALRDHLVERLEQAIVRQQGECLDERFSE